MWEKEGAASSAERKRGLFEKPERCVVVVVFLLFVLALVEGKPRRYASQWLRPRGSLALWRGDRRVRRGRGDHHTRVSSRACEITSAIGD